jgi:hypothetical protein
VPGYRRAAHRADCPRARRRPDRAPHVATHDIGAPKGAQAPARCPMKRTMYSRGTSRERAAKGRPRAQCPRAPCRPLEAGHLGRAGLVLSALRWRRRGLGSGVRASSEMRQTNCQPSSHYEPIASAGSAAGVGAGHDRVGWVLGAENRANDRLSRHRRRWGRGWRRRVSE